MPRPLAALARMDLNLLTVFRAVDETRHVTRAAELLGLSQPALSHALGRLRDAFGDPVFVRTPGGMALTPLGESLAAPVRETLARIEQDILERGPFRPAELSRTFKVKTTDYLEALVAPAALAALASEAPGVRLACLPVGPALPKRELESGACDLAIAGFFDDVPTGFHQEILFEDTFASAVRLRHPLGGKRAPGLQAFCEARHVVVAPGGELSGAVDRALARLRKKRLVAGGTSAFMAAAWIIARTDHVLTAPARLLTLLSGPLRLTVFAPPLTLPPIRVAQVWHARSDADPAHRWFRGLVRRVSIPRERAP